MDTGFFENNVENYVCCAMLSAEVFMSTDHSKVRVWQTHFSVHRPFQTRTGPRDRRPVAVRFWKNRYWNAARAPAFRF